MLGEDCESSKQGFVRDCKVEDGRMEGEFGSLIQGVADDVVVKTLNLATLTHIYPIIPSS